jgi:hypothetical protein
MTETLQIGDIHRQTADGITHSYRLIDRSSYTNKRGRMVDVLTWEGKCPVCGNAFTTTSGPKTRWITRNCPEHRRPHVQRFWK